MKGDTGLEIAFGLALQPVGQAARQMFGRAGNQKDGPALRFGHHDTAAYPPGRRNGVRDAAQRQVRAVGKRTRPGDALQPRLKPGRLALEKHLGLAGISMEGHGQNGPSGIAEAQPIGAGPRMDAQGDLDRRAADRKGHAVRPVRRSGLSDGKRHGQNRSVLRISTLGHVPPRGNRTHHRGLRKATGRDRQTKKRPVRCGDGALASCGRRGRSA